MDSQQAESASMPAKQARNAISDEQKFQLRQHAKENPRLQQADLGRWFEAQFNRPVNQATISKILSKRYEYLDNLNPRDSRVKRHKKAFYPALEGALFHVYQLLQRRGVPVSGQLLVEHAQTLWNEIEEYNGQPYPKLTSGWLRGFQKRYNVKIGNQRKEAGSDPYETEEKMDSIRAIVKHHGDPADIYSMDEIGLWWKATPDRSLVTERLAGRKVDEPRVSLIHCCNANGTHKLPLWMIGQSSNPKAFGHENKNIKNQPITYKANAKACISTTLCIEWLHAFARDTKKVGRWVVLLWDSHPAHEIAWRTVQDKLEFFHIKVVFLPPGPSTPKFQSLDQGIVQNFKASYKKILLQYMVSQSLQSKPINITMLTAMRWSIAAWFSVQPTTIHKCFFQSTFFGERVAPETRRPNYHDEAELIKQLERMKIVGKAVDVNLFLQPEDEKAEDPTTSHAVDLVTNLYGFEPEEEEEEAEIVERPPMNHLEALEALRLLRAYEEQQEDGSVELLTWLNVYEGVLLERKINAAKQTSSDNWLSQPPLSFEPIPMEFFGHDSTLY